jgi:hypothetical protein
MPDGTQRYTYQNGLTCIKSADYATERTMSEKTSIKTIFSSDASYSTKIVNAATISPTTAAIRAALFDACTQYGSGGMTKAQYDEERDALGKLQQAAIAQLIKGSSGSQSETAQPPSSAVVTAPKPGTKPTVPQPDVKAPGTAVTASLPTPKPISSGSDSHFDALFKQYQGDESQLAALGEEAFAKLDYAWTIKFLEQAKTVESSKVWERDYPLLAAAYLLGDGDRTKFKDTFTDMLAEMRLQNSFLHHPPTIGMALQAISNVRQYVDAEGQAYIDDTVTPQVIEIKKRLTV